MLWKQRIVEIIKKITEDEDRNEVIEALQEILWEL